MNILMISEGDITYNGRLIELYNAATKLGNVTLVTVGNSVEDKLSISHHVIKKQTHKYKKIAYILETFKIAKKTKFDVLFVDNTEACLAALLIINLLKPKKVILDSRELYLKGDVMSWKMKLLFFFERKIIKKSNVLICANIQRASVMKEVYSLSNKPIVFENIRLISEQPEADLNYAEQLKKKNITRILFSGGLSQGRALPVINAMKDLGENTELYILGYGNLYDLESARQTIEKLELNNVFIVGQTNRSRLRYFIQNCDIGVVYYSGRNMNEKLCASGKIYEYMQENKPFVAPKLLPLEELCNKHMIGECDNSLATAILRVKNNYSYYQDNVKKFMKQIDVDNNNSNLAESIRDYLE